MFVERRSALTGIALLTAACNHNHRLGRKIMQDREGGCLCRAVRYVLKGEPRTIAICHCTHCQRQSGSVFSFNLLISEADYEAVGRDHGLYGQGR